MIYIQLEDNLETEEVSRLLSSFDLRNFFNTRLWIDILLSSFPEFSAGWITARDGGVLAGVMPVIFKKIFIFHCIRSLPFGTYGTPLSESNSVKRLLVDRFIDLSMKPGCLDAVCTVFDMDWKSWFPREAPFRVAESRIVELKGDFDDYMLRKVNSTKRKTYRRCKRAGVEARPLESVGEVVLFHDIYRRIAGGWGGIHPLPRIFFEKLFSKGGDKVVFLGAFMQGRMLGGHIDLYYGNMAQAWQAGLSEEANRYGVAPYLVLEAVKEAYSRRIKYFNMGSSGGDEGLIDFKESMGGSEINYPVIIRGRRWWKWIRKR